MLANSIEWVQSHQLSVYRLLWLDSIVYYWMHHSSPQPYFLAFWVRSANSLMYVAWKVWREFPCNLHCNRIGDGSLTWKWVGTGLMHVLASVIFFSLSASCLRRRALIVSAILGVVVMFLEFFWYLSLLETRYDCMFSRVSLIWHSHELKDEFLYRLTCQNSNKGAGYILLFMKAMYVSASILYSYSSWRL